MTSSLGQPALEHSSEHRLLRVHGTGADNEERVVDIKKLFDVEKLLGVGKKSIAVKNVKEDFAMQTIANMLGDQMLKKTIFKKWDKIYSLDEVTKQLSEFSKHKRVANLLTEYGKHRAPGRWKALSKAFRRTAK
ncbi:hypothetical protein PR003_g23631 [Phytophthora rubi]|uniref:RxLR effector protein n=1 Tax=Phytophthora rubi TaxID=129364 RepID=A0A6A3IXH9_9STRA|nr:hypothetical protein PR002_g22832 [Phytophthora rubi]KAE8987363.1 hypothetical protein PR001_g22343 [Phytophthora rubi]KAE9296955.1 hypothetical protein PR003_g23631 [Phytophthora rubi]